MAQHFLSPLLSAPQRRHVLRVQRTGAILATDVETAFDSATRRRGLLGRVVWLRGSALVIAPCNAIHTARMRFAIDVVFARRDGRVSKLAADVPPWRVRASALAFAVVELPAGTLRAIELRAGDVLEVVEAM